MPARKPKTRLQLAGLFVRTHARTLSGLLLMSLLAVLVQYGLRLLADPYRFPLNVVEVSGEFNYLDRQQLEKSIAPHIGGAFFTVDVAAICAVAEQQPWVYRAKVRRVWPDILHLQIEEQQPIARWGERGFLNRYGKAFLPEEATAVAGLPQLSGPAGQETRVLERYRQAAGLLAPLGMQVSSLQLDERRAWRLQLQSGVHMELGRVDVWPRLQRLVRAYPAVLSQRMEELRHIDLRYSNGFSVNWRRQAASAAAEGRA